MCVCSYYRYIFLSWANACIYTCTFLIQVCIKGGSKHSAAALREVTEKLEKTNIDLGKATKAAWVVHGRAEVVTIVILWLPI